MEEIESLLASRSPGVSAGWDRYREVPLSFWDLIEVPLGSSTNRPRSLERDEPESGLEAESSPQSIRKYLAQLRSMNDVARCPILAVTGLLNAGKSSIVASFLSETGRKRVLIGQSNHEGTHRFVLWVPESWRNHTDLWQRILQQLEGVFGVRPEVLSEDAQEAARQYNGEILRESSGGNAGSTDPSSKVPRDSLATPLIATDRKLNDWGLALMDCPDIQTGLWLRENLVESVEGESSKGGRTEAELSRDRAIQRGRALNHAMQLCSAFIVVAPANGLHEALIEELLQAMQSRMPDIHRILVVNRVPRKYATSQIASDVQKRLSRFHLHRVYMAYHFEGPHQRDRIPDMEQMAFRATESPFPACFRIDQEIPPQPPEPIAVEDFLVSIGSHYDMAD